MTVPVNVVAVHARNPSPMTGWGNWTYLLHGRAPVLIDAGVGDSRHLDGLAAHASDGPALVLVTHAHPDHASGAPAIAARWPRARFAKHPWPGRDESIDVAWEPLADGQLVESPAGVLEVVHTPGHAPDHVVLWHEASRTAFTGDLLVQGGTVVIPGSGGGSLSLYLASLARVAALGPVRALPAHGQPIDAPLALIARYVAHRRKREDQVLDALAAGAASVVDIAGRIYTDLSPAIVPQAHDSVLAHLVKLEDEGTAVREGEHWRLR